MNCPGCGDCKTTTRVHAQGSRVFSGSPVRGTDDPTSEGAAQPERPRRTSVSRREMAAEIAAERRRAIQNPDCSGCDPDCCDERDDSAHEFPDALVHPGDPFGGADLLDDLAEIAERAGVDARPTDPTLRAADEIVHGPRQDKYGDPVETCARIGAAWGAILGTGPLEARTVAWMMVALKAVRDVSGVSDLDNPIDAAGYCAIAGRALPQDAF